MILFHRIPDRTKNLIVFTAKGTAAVAGVFTFAVSVLMIANYLQLAAADPLNTPALVALRDRYIYEPGEPGVAEDIRALDLLARKAYFTRTWQLRTGTYFLIGGSLLLILSLRLVALLQRSPAIPDGRKATDGRRTSRLILSSVGAVIVIGALATSVLSRSIDLPSTPAGAPGSPGTANRIAMDPFPVGYEDNWPAFRGPYGNGKAFGEETPTEWDGPTGMNVKWVATVPAPGFSSPVVWEGRIFLIGSTGSRQSVFCWNIEDGALLWERIVGPFPGSPSEAPRVTADTGYAASTPATDGKSIYAIFATGDIAALDFDGNVIWGRNMGVPDNHYGHSSSLLTYADTVIVLFDHAAATGLYALDVRNGLERWKTERETQTTWSSPVLAKLGSKWGILVNANPFFAAYAADDGQEIYSYEGIYGEVASSPAYDEQSVIVVNQFMSVVALDLAEGSVRWEQYEDLPDATSPLIVASRLYLSMSFGTLTSTDMETGEIVWRAEFDEGSYSSPVYSGGFVYVFDRSGKAHVFEPSDDFLEISSPVLGERVDTTPAFAEGRIFVRGENSLFCIETTDE